MDRLSGFTGAYRDRGQGRYETTGVEHRLDDGKDRRMGRDLGERAAMRQEVVHAQRFLPFELVVGRLDFALDPDAVDGAHHLLAELGVQGGVRWVNP